MELALVQLAMDISLKKKTLFEMDDNEEIQLVQKEYLRLAQLLLDGTDPLSPKTLEDRDIFEKDFGLLNPYYT